MDRRLLPALRRMTLAAGLAMSAAPAFADVIRLKDGTRLEGTISKTDDGWLVVDASGKRISIPADKVASLEAKPKNTPDAAEQKLASLRRAMDNETDPVRAMERYGQFIKQHPNSPATQPARDDLRIWQDRVDRHMTKIGDIWLTPDERRTVMEQAETIAIEAMNLLAQSRVNEAMPVIERSITSNPQNAAALYLKGVALYRQDKIIEARKAFEAAAALMPDHAPTHNNLAVIMWRQGYLPGALTSYDKAMLASAQDRRVLDNLAEALHSLPEDKRNDHTVRKVVRNFNEQDLALQAKMRERGLFRWGSTWVSQGERGRLEAAEREIQVAMDRMAVDFDVLTARVKQIDRDIDYYERIMRRMEFDSYSRDPATGGVVRYALPPSYYTYSRDLQGLRGEKAAALAEQQGLRRQAEAMQQRLPTQRYTGVQRVIDVEGAPLPGADKLILPGPPVAAAPGPQPGAPAPAPGAPAPGAPGPIAVPADPGPAPGPIAVPADPVMPPQPAPNPPPAIAANPPATRPADPGPRPIPPEKPSIMDRRLTDEEWKELQRYRDPPADSGAPRENR